MRHAAMPAAAILCTALAQQPPAVDAAATVEPAAVKAGGAGRLIVTLRLIEGAHVNASVTGDPNLIPTTFTPAVAAGIRWDKVKYPEPATVTEWYSTEPLKVYRAGATIAVPFAVEKGAAEVGNRAFRES